MNQIKIDEEHLNQTLQRCHKELSQMEFQRETSYRQRWIDLFHVENKSCFYGSFLITIIMIFISKTMNIEKIHHFALIHSALLGILAVYEQFRLEHNNMQEVLGCTKLSYTKIFWYKTNVFLLLDLVLCSLFMICSADNQQMLIEIMVYSIVPLIVISGCIYFVADIFKNGIALTSIYLVFYVIFYAFLEYKSLTWHNTISFSTSIMLLIGAIIFYLCGKTYYKVRKEERCLWNLN